MSPKDAKRAAAQHARKIQETTDRNMISAALASQAASQGQERPPVQRHYARTVTLEVPGTTITVEHEVWIADFGAEQSGHEDERAALAWLAAKSDEWRRVTAESRAVGKLRNMASRAISTVRQLEENASFFAAQSEIPSAQVLTAEQAKAINEAAQILARAFGFKLAR